MDFKSQLIEMVEHAEKAGEEKLTESLNNFVGTLVDALGEDWSEFDKEDLSEDAEEAGDAAIWLDAASYAKGVLAKGGAHFADLELEGTEAPGDIAAAVDRFFEDGTLPAKGLVYVAWSHSPEDYYYVGQASSRKKLKFSGKGELARAIEDANVFSIIVPKKNGQSELSSLSSSLIHLIRSKTDADPTYNEDVDADMPDTKAWKRIEALSDLLEEAGVHLHNRAKLGED